MILRCHFFLISRSFQFSLKIEFVFQFRLANNADHDGMSYRATLHRGHHCLPNIPFSNIMLLLSVKQFSI